MGRHSSRSELFIPCRSMRGGRHVLVALLAAGALVGAVAQASAREHELGGIRLGRPAEQVTQLFGNPTRTFTGVPTGGAGGMGGPGGGMGGPGGGMGGPEGMPGAPMGGPGEMGMPGMPMGPGGMGGMGGMGGGATGAGVPPPQKYEGKIAAMKPEDFIGRLLAAPAAAGGAATGMGMAPGMPGMEGGMGGGMPGMPGMPGMEGGMGGGMPGMPGGMPGAAAGQDATPPTPKWIYERSGDGATFVFGFDEDGRVNLVVVGDDKPYSVSRGGRKPAFAGAKTTKGIGLGDAFKNVIIAYGFPESTEVLGDEVLLKYFERHGVAFTFRQNLPTPGMRVTSITIKSLDE